MEKHLSHKDILNFLKTEKAFLRNEFGVINIGLFGSYAKESQRSDSDIDMVVEIEQSKKTFTAFCG